MSTETKSENLLRGGQFLVKETKCEDVFTLEDLSEEQRMMRDSTKEFVDRELWAHWERFEKKEARSDSSPINVERGASACFGTKSSDENESSDGTALQHGRSSCRRRVRGSHGDS